MKTKVFLLVLYLAGTAFAEKADLVLRNGVIITMDESMPQASALAIGGERILWVGQKEEAGSWIGEGTKVIDLAGAFAYPGFIDSHVHVVALGSSRIQIDLNDLPDKETIVGMVKERVDRARKGEWILGRGWDQNQWPVKAFPAAKDLDPVSAQNPVVLERTDGHAMWVNTVVLKIAEITAQTKDPDGGKIHRDEQGNPTGVLVDTAMELVSTKMRALTQEEVMERTRLALQEALQKGITMVHDAGSSESDLEAFRTMASRNELAVRIYSMVWLPSSFGESFLKTGPVSYGPYLDVRSIKLGIDGAMGSRGAALLEPYADDPRNMGLILWKEGDLLRVLTAAKEKGIQVGIHAIGDKGNRIVLDAYEQLGVKGLRWRIEHVQLLAPPEIPRLSSLGVIASMQPIHATADMPWTPDRIGPQRVQGSYAWRSLLDHNSMIAGGSDAPVEDINPLWGIYAAITRRDHQGNPEGGWLPQQLISREEALRMFTIDAAYAAFREKELGSLKAGKLADMVVLPENLLACEPKKMIDMKVLYAIVGGKIRHQYP